MGVISENNKELCTAGSDAVDAAVRAAYPGREGRFFGTLIPCGFLAGGPRAGVYPLTEAPLTLELVPTRVTDQRGNVLRVIE